MPYCPDCWTEFVAGIPRCSDCDGPLTPGDLPDRRPLAEPPVSAAKAELAAIDTVIGEFPGSRAEFIAQALTMEGIHSRLECEKLVQNRGPSIDPTGPIAVTLPVRILVAAAEQERAQEILESLAAEDLVGEAWAEAPDAAASDPFDPGAVFPAGAEDLPGDGTAPEGSRAPIMLLVIAAFVAILYFMSR